MALFEVYSYSMIVLDNIELQIIYIKNSYLKL